MSVNPVGNSVAAPAGDASMNVTATVTNNAKTLGTTARRVRRDRFIINSLFRPPRAPRSAAAFPLEPYRVGQERCCEVPSPDLDGNRLDRVASVAEPVPLGVLGLHPAGQVGGTGTKSGRSWLTELGEQLPPLPAVPAAFTDHLSRLPWTVADAHVDAGDRRRAGPRDTADGQLAGVDSASAVGEVMMDRTCCRRTGSLTVVPSRCHSKK